MLLTYTCTCTYVKFGGDHLIISTDGQAMYMYVNKILDFIQRC